MDGYVALQVGGRTCIFHFDGKSVCRNSPLGVNGVSEGAQYMTHTDGGLTKLIRGGW